MAPTESTFFPGVQDRLHKPPCCKPAANADWTSTRLPCPVSFTSCGSVHDELPWPEPLPGYPFGVLTHSEARRLICRKTETRVRSKKKWRIIRHSLQSRTPTSPIGGSWLGDIPPNTPLRGERLCFPGSGEGAKQRWLRHLHGTPRGLLASPSDWRCPGRRIYLIVKVADAEAPDQVGCLISFRFKVRMRPGS